MDDVGSDRGPLALGRRGRCRRCARPARARRTQLQPGLSNVNTIAQEGNAKTGLQELERSGIGSGALLPYEALVVGNTSARQVAVAMAAVPGMHGAVAPAGPQWQRPGVAVADSFPIPDGSTTAGRDVLNATRTAVHDVGPGVRLGGIPAQNQDFINAVYGNFPLMILLIAVITFILLARAFRSLLLPLKAVILNVISVAAAWGVLVLVWQEGHGSELIWGIPATGSITAWIPLMVFAFLFRRSQPLARNRSPTCAPSATAGRSPKRRESLPQNG